MATKLRLRLQALKSASALKTLAFAGLLVLVRAAGPHLGILFLFVAGAFLLYAVPLFRTGAFLAPLALLIASSSLALALIPQTGIAAATIAIAVASFYLILALKGLQLIDREAWHYLLVLLLSYLVAVGASLLPQSARSYAYAMGFASTFFAFVLLYRELFRAHPAILIERPVRNAAIATGALLSLQIFWATQLLPLGFVNAAGLNLLTFFLISDSMARFLKQELTRTRLTRNIVLFLGLSILIFAASEWRISI